MAFAAASAGIASGSPEMLHMRRSGALATLVRKMAQIEALLQSGMMDASGAAAQQRLVAVDLAAPSIAAVMVTKLGALAAALREGSLQAPVAHERAAAAVQAPPEGARAALWPLLAAPLLQELALVPPAEKGTVQAPPPAQRQQPPAQMQQQPAQRQQQPAQVEQQPAHPVKLPDAAAAAAVAAPGGGGGNQPAQPQLPLPPGCDYHVFLTHDWGNCDELGRNNHATVSLVNQGLKRRGLVPWFDDERMASPSR